MSLGTPVIVNGQCEVLSGHCKRSNGGLYYENYFEFEGILNYMMGHPEEYGIMRANAQKYVEENYQWNDIMQKFDDAIKMITEEKEK
jgi:glycosyltransferase involved in cell wall biosynthesis